MLSNETALVNIAQQQETNAQQLFGLTEPGLGTAESFYTTLASGDPTAIMQAIAPTAQAAGQASAQAKSNIMANAPAGGEKNLALEMTDVNQAAQVSKAASGASLSAPNALAALSGQGIGESISSATAGTSALGTGSQTLASLGSLQLQGQQINAEEKGSQLGALGGLAGAGAQIGGMSMLANAAGGGGGGALTDAVASSFF
jgi:hypothetical protein